MVERILSLRELNRATLARQFLLEQSEQTPLHVLKHLVGMQAQNHNSPYVALWARLRSFQCADLTQLLESRQVVKAALMRSTLHLMSTDDYLALRPVLQPALSRTLGPFLATHAGDPALTTFQNALLAYVQEQPRTGAELSAKFQEFFPELHSLALQGAMRAHLPLVQVFPSGTWGFTGKPHYTDATLWLQQAFVSSQPDPRSLVLRYLAAFGPASVKDIQAWSGLTHLQHTVDALRTELCTFRNEQGRELFDLPDAPRPSGETPAPVRFLSTFDNMLLSYEDRTRIISEAHRAILFTVNGQIQASFLIDGFVRGMWSVKEQPASSTLLLRPFEPLTPQDRRAVLAEGERFMQWMQNGAQPYEIELREA